jgi:CheY-like chemotaxis protein
VFLNLLINAGKAIAPGQHQTIDVSLEARGDSEYAVTVRDTGCGMSPEVKARLFQPFFTTRSAGQGTGLGLSISLSIVQSYGGSISVESEPGKGSAFTVRLPASHSAQPQKRSSSRSACALRLRVAVVDDEAQVNTALRRALGGEHELTTLENGEELLARVRAGQRFDALLSDLHMPRMSGPELHRQLSALDPALAERTIFMSGGAVTAEVRAFIEANQERLIPKPLDMARLKAALGAFAPRPEVSRA